MGVSTDGILVFGIELGEELPEFLEDFYDIWWDFTDSISGVAEDDPKRCEKRRDFRDNFPVELVSHCSYEYPMYILAVKGTKITASRGSPKVIDPTSLVVSPEKIEKLRKFCEEYRIEWEEPEWYLCSMWG